MAASDGKTGGLARAMAMRVKYRTGEGKKKLCSVDLLGPHPYNRGGAYPSGNRIHLFARLFTVAGYSTIAQGLFPTRFQRRCSLVVSTRLLN